MAWLRESGRRAATMVALASLVAVATLLAAGPPPAAAASVSVKVAPTVFSPNGDGVKDKAKATVRVALRARVFVGVYDDDGVLVKTLQPWRTLAAGARAYTWNGLSGGERSGDGAYTVKVQAKVGHRVKSAKGTLELDTRPPRVRFTARMEPTVFAGGGLTVDLPYTVDEAAGTSLALEVYHPEAGEDELGEAVGSRDVGSAKAVGTIVWDGRGKPGEYLPSSRYALVLEATDVAGNSGRSEALGASVFAPTSVKGTVVTAAGAPVEGAEVDVVGTAVKATSGADGTFTLSGCPMGRRVLRAQKTGMEAGGTGARVNMSPATWTIIMGVQTKGSALGAAPAVTPTSRAGRLAAPASGARRWPWDDVEEWFESSTYRMSGSFAYRLRDGATSSPMRNVKVVLRDVWVDVFGAQVTEDIAWSSTDGEGDYDFTYTVDWDDFGTPDVIVCALAEDEDGEVADVQAPGLIGDTWACTGEYWENNASDRLDRRYTDATANRVVWRLLDAVRWAGSVGYGRSSIDITYPSWQTDESGGYQNLFDTIQIAEGSGWNDTIYHEYGHAWMHAAYDGGDYDYYDLTADTDYDDFFSVEHSWTAFCEGWAQFMALRMNGCDARPGVSTAYECDYDTPGRDDGRIINSVARVLWDLYDDRMTWIWPSWQPLAQSAVPRLCSFYGPGDDDNVQVAGTSSGLETALKHILDTDHPETVNALRTYLRDYFPGNAVLRRGIDGAFYRQGVTAGINENVPHVDAGTVLVTDANGADPPFSGTLTLWCRVTDPDNLGGAADLDRMKVRFEGSWDIDADPRGRRDWTPLTFALQQAPEPPPGRGGGGWFKAEWDTTARSAVEIIPRATDSSPLYARFVENQSRDDMVVTAATTGGTARRDFVWVRAFALDGLAESAPVESAVFAINNGSTQGVSGAIKNASTLAPIAGAAVELRQGTTSMTGTLVATTTSGTDGTYSFPDVAPGGYTAIASKTGFAGNHRTLTVQAGTSLTGQDILLTPQSQPVSMRSTLDGYIRWARQTDNPAATFEFWYRPIEFGGMEYGLDVAQISRDYPNWKGDGLKRWPIMLIWCGDGQITFQVNENVGDESGAWHRVSSTTTLQLGQWYHIAAQNGAQGLKLFINGHLEDSDTSYTGGAEPNQGAAAGGWFSLGDNRTIGSGYMTAVGDFRGLRVSKVQRYSADFTPPGAPSNDADAVIVDPLAGSTNGDNKGFVPTPAGP